MVQEIFDKKFSRKRILVGVALFVLISAVPMPLDGQVTLTPVTTGFNNPIGIDHHDPTNKVVMSVNYASGIPHNFELVASDGSRSQFSSISGFTDEVKIATAKDDGGGMSIGGFTPGELFTGTGVPGVIARISPDGSVVQNPWVTLPGEPGLMRGSLYVDRTGVYGGDLIVVTTAGRVWRVTSLGAATQLASLGTHLEGLTTVPNDATKYGPWAGQILAGAEGQGRIYTIDAQGITNFYLLGINPEDIDIIPANQNFFGVDFGSATLWGAGPSQFTSMVGDILIAQEFPGILWHVHWTGTQFQVTNVAQVTQWEHVTFSTAGISEIPPTKIEVEIDIKPQSCPNPFNPRNKGVVPVAVLGSSSFDVSDIDPSTVELEGVPALRSIIEDVASPVVNPQDDCECTTEGPDGFADLTLKFDAQAIAAALGPVNNGDELVLTLTGELFDGTDIEGTDCVVIRSKSGGLAKSSSLTVPDVFSLGQNFPNPFNPSTAIVYDLPEGAYASLKVFNTLGEEAATLVDGYREAGRYSVTFDAADLPSGVYFYRLVAGNFLETRKLMLLK